jgi:hypothetical protein
MKAMASGPQINLDMNIFKQLIGDAQKFSDVLTQMNGQISQLTQTSQNMGQAMGGGIRAASAGIPPVGMNHSPSPILGPTGAPIGSSEVFNPFSAPNFQNINRDTAYSVSKAQYASMMQGMAADAERDRQMSKQSATWTSDPVFMNDNFSNAASGVKNDPLLPGYKPPQFQNNLPVNSLKVMTPQEQMQSLMHQASTGSGITSLPQALDIQKYFKGDGAKNDIDSLNKLSETLSKKDDAGSRLIVEELKSLKDSLEKNQEIAKTAIERYAKALEDAGSNPEKKAEAFSQLNSEMQRASTAKEQAQSTAAALGGAGGEGGDGDSNDARRRAVRESQIRGNLIRGAQVATAGLAVGRAVIGTGFDLYSGMEGRDISSSRETFGRNAANIQGAVQERDRFYNISSAEDFIRTRGDVMFGMGTGTEYLGATGRSRAQSDSATELARELNLSRQGMTAKMLDIGLGSAQVVAGSVAAAGTGGIGGLMMLGGAAQGMTGAAGSAKDLQSNEYYRMTQGGTAGGVFGSLQNWLGTASAADVAKHEKERTTAEFATRYRERAQQLQDSGVAANAQYIQGIQSRLDLRQQNYHALSQVGGYAVGDVNESDMGRGKAYLGLDAMNDSFSASDAQEMAKFGRLNRLQGKATRQVKGFSNRYDDYPILGAIFGNGTNRDVTVNYQDSLSRENRTLDGTEIRNEFAGTQAQKIMAARSAHLDALNSRASDAMANRAGMESLGANEFSRLGLGNAEAAALRNQASQYTGAGGGQASRAMTVEVARLGLIGMGSSEQLLGQLGGVNQVAGGRDNLDALKKVMQEAISSGFDRSALAQQFVSSAINMASQLGTTNVASVAAQLGTSAGMLGRNGIADERSLKQAEKGMAALNNFTGRVDGAVGATKAMAIFSSGATLESGAGMLQDMNSQEMQSALAQVKNGDVSKMDPKVRLLFEKNPNLREILEKSLQATGSVAMGNLYSQFNKKSDGSTDGLQDRIRRISGIKDKDARKEALQKLQGDLEIVATSNGLGYGAGAAFLSQELEGLGKGNEFDSSSKNLKDMKKSIEVPAELQRKNAFGNATKIIADVMTQGSSKDGDSFLRAMLQAESQGVTGGFNYTDKEGRSSTMSYKDYKAMSASERSESGALAGFKAANQKTDLFDVSARMQASAAGADKIQSVYLSGLDETARDQIVSAVSQAMSKSKSTAPVKPGASTQSLDTGKNAKKSGE